MSAGWHLDPAVAACPASSWTGNPDACRWCDRPLPPIRRRWCSPRCMYSLQENHVWEIARTSALARDGYMCRRCGVGNGGPLLVRALLLLAGHPADYPRHETVALEVHHRIPRRGGGYAAGCAHHQATLETLCQACHHDETRSQRDAYPRDESVRQPAKPGRLNLVAYYLSACYPSPQAGEPPFGELAIQRRTGRHDRWERLAACPIGDDRRPADRALAAAAIAHYRGAWPDGRIVDSWLDRRGAGLRWTPSDLNVFLARGWPEPLFT